MGATCNEKTCLQIRTLRALILDTKWSQEAETRKDGIVVTQLRDSRTSRPYGCFKVLIGDGELVFDGHELPREFIAKLAEGPECLALKVLSEKDAPVPVYYGQLQGRDRSQSILCEELVSGRDMVGDASPAHWATLGRALAETHLVLWDDRGVLPSDAVFDRMHEAKRYCSRYCKEMRCFASAIDVLKRSPVAMVNGDMLPVNAIVNDMDDVYIIDWEMSGAAPFSIDLGTLLVSICRELPDNAASLGKSLLNNYHKVVANKIDRTEFLRSVYSALYIETAALLANVNYANGLAICDAVRSFAEELDRC